MTIKLKKCSGFTLYYAVFFGSILLVIGASILSLTLKEAQLSTSLRDSEYAFAAADAGTECALYWDLKGVTIGEKIYRTFPVTYEDVALGNSKFSYVMCGNMIGAAVSGALADQATTSISFNVNNKYGVMVLVGKRRDANGDVFTTIESRGYNSKTTVSNSRKVERMIVTRY